MTRKPSAPVSDAAILDAVEQMLDARKGISPDRWLIEGVSDAALRRVLLLRKRRA